MISRYARQMMLPEIGIEGQRRLSSSRAAVVGAGGLGSPALYYLASAGVGYIRIIDSDIVEMTNLNRQFLHFEKDIGREKAQSASEKLRLYNPDIQIHAATVPLDEKNAPEYLSGCDAVLSCVDNQQTRYLLNSACVKSGTPLIDGGVRGFEGYVLTVLPHVTPCYRCIFPNERQPQEVTGILGATAGVLGAMMAMRTIQQLIGIPIRPYLHFVDLISFCTTPVNAERAPDCPVCGTHPQLGRV